MANNVKTYPNITPEKMTQLMTELTDAGGRVAGDTVTLKGVTVQFVYANDALTLTITHKSFPANLLSNDKIFSLVEENARLPA